MFNLHKKEQNRHIFCQERIKDKLQESIFSKKLNQPQKFSIMHQTLFQNKENELITVPIKQYSNKFLREKKKEQQQSSCKKKEPFPNSHLYHNRKLISEFKKYKGRSQKFKNHINKENGDFIIYNLLFEKDDCLLSADPQRKTIFGTFTQNFAERSQKIINEESLLFENGFKTTKNGTLFQVKKEVYEKICEKQKSIIPEIRKKCKTLVESSNYESFDNDRKLQKISTSRALEKYSKIIKVNPEHGKIEKMKIKKDLAKSLRFESCEKSEIETKQITLARKEVSQKSKNIFQRDNSQSKIHRMTQSDNKENEGGDSSIKTPDKMKGDKGKENVISSKVRIFSSGIKFKKFRKFSHQVQSSNKKCITEEKRGHQGDETFDDFEINGWDINF